MGKQVKNTSWTPPQSDVSESAWTPPETDDLELKKKDLESQSTSSSDSTEPGKPSKKSGAKPTPTTRLKERVTNYVSTSQQGFNDEADKKLQELQQLVDSDPTKTDQANRSFKDFLSEREKVYNADLDKWMGIYSDQFKKEEFDENKETNFFASIGKNAWATLSKDLPAQGYGAHALLSSSAKKLDETIVEGAQAVGVKPIEGEMVGDINKFFDSAIKFVSGEDDKSPVTMTRQEGGSKVILDDIKKSISLSKASEEDKKFLVNSLDKVKDGDFVDWMNYAGSAIGQGVGQIPTSVLSKGASSLVQQMGSIYMDSVQKIAQEEGISVDDVIKQGKDDVVYPLIFGIGTGLLDAVGAKGVLGAVSKKQVMDSFRKRALGVLGAATEAGGIETVTEAVQTGLEEIGVGKAQGKTWSQTLNEFKWEPVIEGALQGGIAGMFLGGGGKVLSNAIKRIVPKQTVVKPVDVIKREEENMDVNNPASREQAAEKIVESINQEKNGSEQITSTDEQLSVDQTSGKQGSETVQTGRDQGEEKNIDQKVTTEKVTSNDTTDVQKNDQGLRQSSETQGASAEGETVLPATDGQSSDKSGTGGVQQQPANKDTPTGLDIITSAARSNSKDDFLYSELEIPIKSLDNNGVSKEDMIAKSGTAKSRTPHEPVIVRIDDDGKIIVLDGLHRYYDKLGKGEKTIKIRFYPGEGAEQFFDRVNQPQLTPKQKAESELNALVESGDISRDGNKITIITEKGGVEAKRIHDELSQSKPADVKKLEADRDAEILQVGKPDLKLDLISAKELVNSKDPIANKQKHDDLKVRYRALKALTDCLWKKK